MSFKSLDEEIQFYENRDSSEIINMFVEKQFIYQNNNKIKANKIFEKYYEKYLDRRLKIGKKRMELYTKRNELRNQVKRVRKRN
ncbi:MAG: hypothetical protein HRU18_01815 [Pseudoalteromonas sp.]|uniref:hypothetical protein n=1 Tax=Pseudoalteromonas sp. TaxID=53249 RepID=UPI001D4FB48A|nr:hypothetical protein [Pseudoalteromonas sp.]NRA76919.1 hypothetical protein [Pseudoalteromonas sp.]